jgi:hypothetical protein
MNAHPAMVNVSDDVTSGSSAAITCVLVVTMLTVPPCGHIRTLDELSNDAIDVFPRRENLGSPFQLRWIGAKINALIRDVRSANHLREARVTRSHSRAAMYIITNELGKIVRGFMDESPSLTLRITRPEARAEVNLE